MLPKAALWLLAMGANLVWNLSEGLLFTLFILMSLPDVLEEATSALAEQRAQGTMLCEIGGDCRFN